MALLRQDRRYARLEYMVRFDEDFLIRHKLYRSTSEMGLKLFANTKNMRGGNAYDFVSLDFAGDRSSRDYRLPFMEAFYSCFICLDTI